MATVFRRVRWVAGKNLTDPATGRTILKGRICPKDLPGAVQVKSKNYTIAIYLPGGKLKTFNGGRRRDVAEQKAADYERQKARGEVGLLDPFEVHRRRPLADHVADWLRDRADAGRDEKYLLTAKYRMERLLSETKWKSLADVTAAAFDKWRDAQPKRADGKPVIGPVTSNQWFETLRAFMNWCVKRKRWQTHDLVTVEKRDESTDIRRERRALTVEEMGRLAAVLPDHFKLVYRLIWTTGLRRDEAAQLQWRDVRLSAVRPFLSLRAETTKNAQADELPLRSDIAAELDAWRHGAGDDELVFPAMPSIHRHRTFLKLAKIDWLDQYGRRADFHAMRHTYCTHLATSGASIQESMALMRHSDVRLTANFYTDPKVFSLGSRVDALPLPSATEKRSEGDKAVG